MAPLKILLLYGTTASGKTYATERVLGIEYEVTTAKMDSLYYRALNHADVPIDPGRRNHSVYKSARRLRAGEFDERTASRVWSELRAGLREHIANAWAWRVGLVLDGYTLKFADEVRAILEVAQEVSGGEAEVWRAHLRPSLEQWNANRAAKILKLRGQVAEPSTERYWARKMAPADPVEGVHDRTIAEVGELRALVDEEVGLRRHRWYQRFELGPIATTGPSDAAEKVAAVRDEDILDRSVLDLCCATGVHAIMARQRGAAKVIGVEREPRRFSKALELQKTLKRHSDVDAGRVRFELGDALEVMQHLQQFDTTLLFGALHYFPRYDPLLRAIAEHTRRAAYLEVTFAEGEHDAERAPGEIRPWVRSKTGTTIYMGDRATVERVVREAMPGFEIDERTPISPPGRTSDREVWRVCRQASA